VKVFKPPARSPAFDDVAVILALCAYVPRTFGSGRLCSKSSAHFHIAFRLVDDGRSAAMRATPACQMHTEFHLDPTEADIREMKKALSSDKTFLKFTQEEKETLYSGIMGIKCVIELYDDVDELNEMTNRTRYARKLQSSLDRLISVLNEDVGRAHLLETMGKMRDALGLTSQGIVNEVAHLKITAARLLQGSKQARPRLLRKSTNLPITVGNHRVGGRARTISWANDQDAGSSPGG
jgi:hypothetical protein